MKHDWVLDETGEIDIWQFDVGHCNGPRCLRCGQSFCEHCHPSIYKEECPSGQQELFRLEDKNASTSS